MTKTAGTMSMAILLLWCCQVRAEPAVFWFNDPVGPDETMLMTGADLDRVASVTVSRVSDGEGATTPPIEVDVLQQNSQSLKLVIPPSFTPGVYAVSLRHATGSIEMRANMPTAFWSRVDFDESGTQRASIRLFGRNILRRHDRARLEIVDDRTGQSVVAAAAPGGDLWQATFAVPPDMRPGRHRLRLHNGDGGESAWIDAGTIEYRRPFEASQRQFDVRGYGALGDGSTSASRAFTAALEAARQAGGGTVFVPRGRYLLTEPIVIPPDVVLKGERTDRVALVFPDWHDPPETLIRGSTRFAIEDVTIYASNHRHVVSGGFTSGDTPVPGASDIAIRRVRIRASAYRSDMPLAAVTARMAEIDRRFPGSGPDSIRLTGIRLVVTGCDIVGTGRSLYVFDARDVTITSNVLRNGRLGWYSLTGSRRIVFERNLITGNDLQATGGSLNTLTNKVSSSENAYVARNTFQGIYGWDREALTTDGPAGYYFGKATSVGPDTIALLGSPNPYTLSPDWSGSVVMVVAGRGTGQHARVTAQDRISAAPRLAVTLDRRLAVALDDTSVITIAPLHRHYLVIGNSFEDTGVAFQNFGSGIDHVVAGNSSVRTAGYHVVGLDYHHVQPGWQIQLLDNVILEGNTYRAGPDRDTLTREAAIGIKAIQPMDGADRPPLVRAIVVRGNRLEQDAHIEVKGFNPRSPGTRDVVIEANLVGGSRTGLFVDRGVAWWLERRNTIIRLPR